MRRSRYRPTRPGSYSLLIWLLKSRTVRVGKLGAFRFVRGYYVYTGSAMSGLDRRIGHHLRKKSRPRWHVDFLLSAPGARVERWVEWETPKRAECALNRRFLRAYGAAVPVRGFGSSDCRAACPAHLVYFRQKPDMDRMAEKSARR